MMGRVRFRANDVCKLRDSFSAAYAKVLSALTAIVFSCALFPADSMADQLTPQEKRGKQIYTKTTSPSGGEIQASVGKALMEVPGASLPCTNCHGHDGVGLVESGVTATTITWEELTKAYGVKHGSGRGHPPYDEARLAVAISEGLDPAGNVLDVAMPRYKMSREDMNDLIAYIRRLGTVLDPGLTENAIRVGTLLPKKGQHKDMGRVMEAVINAYFAEINKGGGVYNRKIELRVLEYDSSPALTIESVRQLIEKEEVFALVSPFTAGADSEISDLVETEQVPVFGPFTLFPEDAASLKRFTFYLFSGPREQMRALAVHAREKLPDRNAPIAIVFREDENLSDTLDAFESQAKKLGWNSVERVKISDGGPETGLLANEMSQRKTEGVIFMGPWKNLKSLIGEAEKIKWRPYFFVSGSRVQKDLFDLPASFSNRVFLAYPTLPSDHSEAGMREFNRLLTEHKLTRDHLAAQVSAYSAAKIMVEGLKRTGRKLSREKLVTTMDRLYEFDTGMTPRISYDPNRRIGALGAYVVGVDLEKKSFLPDSKWIPLDPH